MITSVLHSLSYLFIYVAQSLCLGKRTVQNQYWKPYLASQFISMMSDVNWICGMKLNSKKWKNTLFIFKGYYNVAVVFLSRVNTFLSVYPPVSVGFLNLKVSVIVSQIQTDVF